jgi:hypothetical protein
MPKAKRSLDLDTARKLFRQHLARADEILTGHAQRAMSEAHGSAKRAATIMIPRLKADAALEVEVEALDRLRELVFPPMDSPWLPFENPKCRKRKSPKRRNRKTQKSNAQKT